jgi:hypothetical protein
MSDFKGIATRHKEKFVLTIAMVLFISLLFVANASADLFWKDYNGNEDGGYMPDIDQKQVFSRDITEENGSGVICTGNWSDYTASNASGGSIKYSDMAGDFCTLTFDGTSVSYIATPSNNKGVAEVLIDGQHEDNVDLYSANLLWQQVLFTKENLSPGTHTITIKVTNSSTHGNTRIDVDAFAVGNVAEHYCSPVAEANSLWWLDKAYRLGIFKDPYSETEMGYIGGDINYDGVSDVRDLVEELAILMKTNVKQNGTLVQDEQDGIDAFLRKYVIAGELFELTTAKPTLNYITQEVKISKDIKLDLGFWHVDSVEHKTGTNERWIVTWTRVGGHSVSVAGVGNLPVCSISGKICGGDQDCAGDGDLCTKTSPVFAISDPYFDAAEADPLKGVVRPVPGGHPSVHNNEANASHDYYKVVPSISPGGMFALEDYPVQFPISVPEDFQENNGPMQTVQVTYQDDPGVEPSNTFAEIEAAVSVYPKIIVQAPNGGGVIPSGEIYPISWSSSLPGAMVRVQLSQDNGSSWPQDVCDTVSTYCFWNVPKVVASKLKNRVKVGYLNGDSIVGYDTSDKRFKIAAVDITYPDGGETLKSGNEVNINWETYIKAKVAKVELSYKCGTDTWPSTPNIGTINGNPGTYEWKVPNVQVMKNKCKVRVVLKKMKPKTDPPVYVNVGIDPSDGTFKIQPKI